MFPDLKISDAIVHIRRCTHIALLWVVADVQGTVFLVYLRVLLLSLPSHEYGIQLLEECREILQNEDAKTVLPASWRRARRDSFWIILASAVLASFQYVQPNSASRTAAEGLSCICVCCCLVCIVLVRSMRRHLINMQNRHAVFRGTPGLPLSIAEVPSTAAPMILSAPTAWRIWAFLMFGFSLSSLLCSAAESGVMTTEVAEAILQLKTANCTLIGDLGVPRPTTLSPTESLIFLCLPVVTITIVGLWHIGFVCIYFPRLDRPDRGPEPITSQVEEV